MAYALPADFPFVYVYFLYFHDKNGSGIINVFETNKHLNTMQNHWVVQIRKKYVGHSFIKGINSLKNIILMVDGPR